MQPICEPVDLPLGVTALVAQVAMPDGTPPPARLLHFHDVVEVVLFGDSVGQLICEGRRYAITPGAAVLVPSMCYHDYHFADDGARNWTLIQFEPYLFDHPAGRGLDRSLTQPLCVEPDAAAAARLRMLADWLAEATRANPADAMIERIVALIVGTLVHLPRVSGEALPDDASHLSRFLPVVEALRRAPGARLTLAMAATLCHVSPAYFSRRFAAVFGCGFADYVTSYRLHVASRRIATTAEPVSNIGYDLGFSSHSHFTARFRERFGVAPRDYRKRVSPAAL